MRVRGSFRAEIAGRVLRLRIAHLNEIAARKGREEWGAWRERIVFEWLHAVLKSDPRRTLGEICDAIPLPDEAKILNDDARREP